VFVLRRRAWSSAWWAAGLEVVGRGMAVVVMGVGPTGGPLKVMKARRQL
jgi:hypothetical protein